MINFITTILVAIQVLIGQVAVLHDIDVQDNHRIWVEIQEPCFSSVYDDDQTECKDDWTDGLAVHIAHLSTGEKLPILCETPNDAWEKLEVWLWNKNDCTTSILSIVRDEW